MYAADQDSGDLIRFDPRNDSKVERLPRLPLGPSAEHGGMDEKSLRELLFRFPSSLPLKAIDTAYCDPVPICRELRTLAGPLVALYINDLGRIIVAEFKLWLNPQARQ